MLCTRIRLTIAQWPVGTVLEVRGAAMCDGLMNGFILIPSHTDPHIRTPETAMSSPIRQSTTSRGMDVSVTSLTFCFISFPVIDLLAALNMSHHISGVARVQSPSSVMYRIRSRAPYLTLPPEYSQILHSSHRGSMGLYFVGRQSPGSSATLFSLSSTSSPILQIISSTPNDTLYLDYQAGGGAQGLASFHLPRRNPFSSDEWVQLAVSLEPNRLAFFVDCQEAVVVPLKSEERINLELPQNVVITLASTPRRKASKFNVRNSLLHMTM